VLSADDLAKLRDARPRLEKEFRLPGDSRQRNKIFMFSIDGWLNGERLTGCLFAGECILVQAPDFEKALKLAKDGLASTCELLFDAFQAAQSMVVVAEDPSKVKVDIGGRRAAALRQADALETDPKLKAMIRHQLGGEPWKY
jgi:hypothetical protein